MVQKMQERVFAEKNRIADPEVMSTELYDRIAQISQIDQAIYEAEKEVEEGAEPVAFDAARDSLDRKYFGEK